MVTIDVVYEGDLHCTATHAPSGSTLVTDAPADNQGRGEAFSPTDLVATALASCVLTIMGLVARRHGIDLAGARAVVRKEMAARPVRRIQRLETEIRVPIDPGPEGRALLENAARACPVHHSLHAELEAPLTFRWGRA